MRRFFQSGAFKAFICVIVALCLGAVIAAFTHNNSTPLSSATSTALYPLQRFSSYLSYKFSNFNDNFKGTKSLAEENEKLKDQIEDYQQKIIDYNDIKKKLNTYEDFLGVKEDNPDFIFENASIISRSSSDNYGTFTLNKGSLDGISVNDPVIYGKNVVGVVTGVSAKTCTIITISNPEINISVYETYTGEVGYVSGIDSEEDRIYCKIPGIKKEAEISPNGIVCTAGNGGIFPKDLIVGTIVDIEDSKDGISKFANIRSEIDLSELSEVFVIIDFEGQGVVTVTGD